MFIVEPYQDELLSSWFMRLARKNRTNVSTLVCHIFKNDILAKHTSKLHIKDIDLYYFNKSQKEMIYKHTGVHIDNLQLFKYSGILDEVVDRYHKKWIAESKTHIHNAKHFYGARFCPLCLKEKIYIPQLWRVMFYNICKKHSCYLHVVCPQCNATFMYNDNGYIRDMNICYKCSFDLKDSSTHKARQKEIDAQKKLLSILHYGYYKVNNRYYYSISFFPLLRHLINTIGKVHNVKNKYINQLTTCTLAKIISHTLFLLEYFPRRMNKFYKNNDLTNLDHILPTSARSTRHSPLPSWFLNGIHYNTVISKVTAK